jgi:hypothetical protein
MMQHEARGGRGQRRLRLAALAAAVGSVALLVACSGAAGTGASGSPGASPSSTTGSLAFSECMRAHGIANFPDPNSSGGINIPADSGINMNSSQYQSAAQACQSKQGGQQSQAQQDVNYNADLRYARCMQARGVDIPDPVPPGGSAPVSQSNSSPGTGDNSGGSGANPNSPQYIAANKACEHYLPTGQGPSLGSSGGGS